MTVQTAYIPAGKIRCFITGELRNDTPEENVRQRIARSLVEEYGYPKEDIDLEFRINIGRARKRVDIAVFTHEQPHTQENIVIIAETKRDEIKPTDRDNGVEQLKSYLAACPNAKWGLWVGSELQAYEMAIEAGERRAIDVADIPPYGKTQPPRITFTQLIPAEGLRDVFRRCHNYIYANQGLPKDQAFHELLKLIFCKVQDEKATEGEMRFDITSDERRSEMGQRRLRKRIDKLFAEVKERYQYIFEPNDRIRLDNRVLAYIVSELRRYSLLQTATDIKGEAYQEIVRANLRGARGEFFTPPNVCQMAVDNVFATYPQNRWLSLKVLDPAGGTGGFLRAVMNLWRNYIFEQEKGKWKQDHIALEKAAARLKEHCDRSLFGIDINPDLVRAAQMNLVMHGDGSTNVFQANSLLPPGEWREDVKAKIQLGTFDIVLTNPPFGTGPGLAVDDPHILDQFELTRFEANSPRASMPPEQLFIERCYQLLKPGGLLAIVLPDSILSNPGLVFIRHWILKRCRIVASIDLPVETFLAFGGTGTQTSVLVMQKKTEEEVRLEEAARQIQDYEVFMALCQTMGYDRRGNDLWLRTPEGEIIEQEVTARVITRTPEGLVIYEPKRELRRIRDDEVAQVASLFQQWWQEKGRRGQ
jgi:type I restriction enzyme M protein